jgi:leucyl-tRNA synthetase
MFMGPLDVTKPWDDKGVKGVYNFLSRASRFFGNPENITTEEDDKEILKSLHYTIKKVETDIENLRFNTAISAMMIFLNNAIKKGKVSGGTASLFALILAPFEDFFEYPVSFNGKMRYKLELPVDMPKEEIAKIVMADERTAKWITGVSVSNIIVVPNRIINVVIKGS